MPIGYDPQILNIYPLLSADAVISVQPILDKFPFRIEMVEDYISICFVTRSKHYHLVVLICLFKALDSIGPNINSGLNSFPIGESHVDDLVTRVVFYVINAMDKGLIQIED